MTVNEICALAKDASPVLAVSGIKQRNKALLCAAERLRDNLTVYGILKANSEDVEAARANGMPEATLDRLTLTAGRLEEMASSLCELAALPDVLGAGECFTRPNGLKFECVRVPLGVIGIIYEARPNVTADAAGICIKTGNAVVLRGGKEAVRSNAAVAEAMRKGLSEAELPCDAVGFISDTSRESSNELMAARGLIDVLIPRGGRGLIQAVCQNARVPVIETGAGNCHVYIEKTADIDMAVKIAVNAKMQRPSVCNAAETLLVDEEAAERFLPKFYAATRDKNLQLRCCEASRRILPQTPEATEEDYYKEYNDYIMAVKVVSGVEEAVEHINKYSTHHSEAIITKDTAAADYFTEHVDSAAVYVNASTRFTDGGEFGFGAEIGISTQKLHARGPMGPKQLTSVKYIVRGNGQVR